MISASVHPATVQGELFSLICESPEAQGINSSSPELTTLSSTALQNIFLRSGFTVFGATDEIEGSRIEMFCNETQRLIELTLKTEIVDSGPRSIAMLLLMPQTAGLAEIQAAAQYLGAELGRFGNRWYAVINKVSPDLLVRYARKPLAWDGAGLHGGARNKWKSSQWLPALAA